jgi:hypothetical protein
MSDPLRDPTAAGDAEVGADRTTKIEQLLLDGLDEYFAGRFDQAINVWTRALFFDRHHPRARAYIERARAALAERHRQSEELLESGVAAFTRGDGATARRLIEDAIERGAPADEARAVLERLTRIEQGSTPASVPAHPPEPTASGVPVPGTAHRRPRSRAPLWFMIGAAAAVAVIGFLTLAQPAWWPWRSADVTTSAMPPRPVTLELPVPRRSEQVLARAHRLAAGGRLRDALAVLETVRPTDVEREDADRLRANIQRQLLALVPGSFEPTAAERP